MSAEADPGLGKWETQRRRKTVGIVQAATRLFRAHGYEAVTTQQIADEAGVTNGVFFRHVGTKSDLLVRVVGDQLRTGHDQAMASLGRSDVLSLPEKFRTMTARLVQTLLR